MSILCFIRCLLTVAEVTVSVPRLPHVCYRVLCSLASYGRNVAAVIVKFRIDSHYVKDRFLILVLPMDRYCFLCLSVCLSVCLWVCFDSVIHNASGGFTCCIMHQP